MITKRPFVTFGLAAATLAVLAGAAEACPRDRAMAGVVQRVTGQRGEVYIERAGTERIRPAPMESLCEGDVIIANAQGASITLRLDGSSASTLLQGPGRYTLPPNSRRANVVDNALQLLLETWMPDIKRSSNFGVVRGRLGEPPEWATPGLEDGLASIRRGSRSLLLRWSGDPGLYRVEVARADGQIVEKEQVNKTEVRLPSRNWTGQYTVRIYQGTSKTAALTGRFRATDAPPRNPHDFPDTMGEEVRAASEALRIVSLDPQRWSLEAIQIIDRAPAQGLDRDVLFRSIASQGQESGDGSAN